MGSRLLVFYIFVPIIIFLVLRNPFFGIPFLALYHSWRPTLWGAPSFFRPEFLVTLAMLFSVGLRQNIKVLKKLNSLCIAFIALSVWLFITSHNAIVDVTAAYTHSVKFLKVVVILCLFGCVINNLKSVKVFYWYLIAGLVWMSKSIFWQYFLEGRSRADPLGGGGGGGNAIATELCMTLPFLLMIFFETEGWQKRCAGIVLCIWFVDLVAIASRGGFLAASVAILLFFLYFPYRGKLIRYALIGLIVGCFMVPTFFWERMGTIVNYEEDASAMSRFVLWDAGFEMFKNYPVYGVGTMNFQLLVKTYSDSELIPDGGLVAHNNYIQLLAENGFIGLGLYLLGFCLSFIFLRKLKRHYKETGQDEGVSLCSVIEIALITFMLRGMTGTNYVNEIIFYFLGVVAGLYNHLDVADNVSFSNRELGQK